ncbi:MAG: glycosyltransferase family 2 protein [Acutalibacteraceae bacterium]|nr:glycosyltransferase family 2 protein [Acutalibacteraceae bacterium]
MKLITFTVPCYNSAEYMRKCVDSLLKGGDKVEIIIVNDGSSDDTGKIADEYKAAYPDIVKVIHQPNGGHGAGINAGLKIASGKYFKVVDSDDWLDTDAYLNLLYQAELAEEKGGVDLIVCNYCYYQQGKGIVSTIKYSNVFPEKKICSWAETHSFRINQYLTLHSAILRTETIRMSGIVLPHHIFYEDNLFIYAPLPYVEKILYLNINLYMYWTGRDGQSVSNDNLLKRCTHQITVTERIFDSADPIQIMKTNKKLGKYLHHELELMYMLSTIFTRLNFSDEHDKLIDDMWDRMHKSNPALCKKMRRNFKISVLNTRGKFGRHLCKFFFGIAHLVVRFN